MKNSHTLLLATLLLPALAAHAQTKVCVGPRLGLNLSSAPFKDTNRSYATTARAGLEVGLVGSVDFGHFAVQPSFLYSQKGFNISDSYTTTVNATQSTTVTTLDEQYRLNYFTVPLNLIYSQGSNGQGFQGFAGPYVGWLLGGTYRHDDRDVTTTAGGTPRSSTTREEGDVGTGNYYTTNLADNKFYSRSFDAGLQFGLGYRRGGVLFQAGYSLGLRNLGADYKINYGQFGTKTAAGPTYQSRVLQFSLTYLFETHD